MCRGRVRLDNEGVGPLRVELGLGSNHPATVKDMSTLSAGLPDYLPSIRQAIADMMAAQERQNLDGKVISAFKSAIMPAITPELFSIVIIYGDSIAQFFLEDVFITELTIEQVRRWFLQ